MPAVCRNGNFPRQAPEIAASRTLTVTRRYEAVLVKEELPVSRSLCQDDSPAEDTLLTQANRVSADTKKVFCLSEIVHLFKNFRLYNKLV